MIFCHAPGDRHFTDTDGETWDFLPHEHRNEASARIEEEVGPVVLTDDDDGFVIYQTARSL